MLKGLFCAHCSNFDGSIDYQKLHSQLLWVYVILFFTSYTYIIRMVKNRKFMQRMEEIQICVKE